jgi:hypothetical protein
MNMSESYPPSSTPKSEVEGELLSWAELNEVACSSVVLEMHLTPHTRIALGSCDPLDSPRLECCLRVVQGSRSGMAEL